MSVHDRIRQLVAGSGGRASVDDIVREAMGVAGAKGALARKLVEATLREARGLVLDGDHVVERAQPASGRIVALALAPAASSTALPAAIAWLELPSTSATPTVISLVGDAWREGVQRVARELADAEIHALSAASARRVLRLGARVAGLEADEEPTVVAIGPVAKSLGIPLRNAEDAATLVGSSPPESPEQAALLLARLVEKLAEIAKVDPAALRDLAEREVAPEFDFGERVFARADVLALPEVPGIYIFEDAEGDVAYVGKAKNLRRRVATYFGAKVEERDSRIREAAHSLSHERTGTELSALLREQQLIRDLVPALNVQEDVHSRKRSSVEHVASRGAIAVVQPSADGGAEIVLLDRGRGVEVIDVVPEGDAGETAQVVRRTLSVLRTRPASDEAAADVEIALTWLADNGASASVVDAAGDLDAVATLLVRVARDPDLKEGRIVVA